MTHDDYYRGQRMGWWCTRTTAAGAPCKGNQVGWSESEVPDPRACVGHLTQAERAEWKEIKQRVEAKYAWMWEAETALFMSDPACWSWPSPDAGGADRIKETYSASVREKLTDMDFAEQAMDEWHEGRCAICGHRESLVTDHDHQTGLVRGKLCRSCNTCEGTRHGGVWDKYRQRNPATIWEVESPYIDPFTLEEAKPAPPWDPWKNNPMKGLL